MVIVCYCLCCRKKTRRRRKFLRARTNITTNQLKRGSNQLVDEDLITGPVQLLEVIENEDNRFKLWKGSYEGFFVCVKVFKPTHQDMWANERTLCSLSTTTSEFIYKYIGSQRTNFHLHTLSDYYPMGTLNNYLQHNIVNLTQTFQIVHTVSLGLAHLHSNFFIDKEGACVRKIAIAHRNVKSANIWLKNDTGHCVLGDLSQALHLNPRTTVKSLMNLNRKRKVFNCFSLARLLT